jgi:integrase
MPRQARCRDSRLSRKRGRTLRVERALSLGRIKPPKTYEERSVDVTPELLQTIRQHLAWLRTEALRHGSGEPDWLFPNEEGKPMDESRVRKAFKRALKDAKLPAFRLYDLRHTYASLLLAERHRSRTWPSSSGTRTPRRRCGTTRGGSRARGSGGRTCWIGLRPR